MATISIESYYWDEIDQLDTMLEKYNEFGYSPELKPLVKALEKAKEELTDQLTLITNQRILNHEQVS